MAEDIRAKRETTYKCPECGLRYREKETAMRCEAWCREHQSCNLEIIANALPQEEGEGENAARRAPSPSFLWRTALTPIIFELCGLAPVLLIALGVVSVSAGVALRNTLVFQYYWVFFIAAGGFYVLGLFRFLKTKNQCTTAGLRKNKWFIGASFLLLALVEGIVLLVNRSIEIRFEENTLIHNYNVVPAIGFPLLFLLAFVLYLHRTRSHE